jgi:crossover junction endodeoxyribonuclease RuvC
MGYGVLDVREGGLKPLAAGVLTASRSWPLEERLFRLYGSLVQLLQQYKPDQAAVEEPFVPRDGASVRSALAVGQAQAVAFMAAASQGIPVHRYTPAQVKQTVAEYGRSSKEQVQEMVGLLLGLKGRPEPSDAADALAVALCHIRHQHVAHLLASAENQRDPR